MAVPELDSAVQQSRVSVTHRHKYLAGYVTQRLHLADWSECLSARAKAEDCISYNFDSKLQTCEINNAGLTEFGRRRCQGEKLLLFSQGLIFQHIRGR